MSQIRKKLITLTPALSQVITREFTRKGENFSQWLENELWKIPRIADSATNARIRRSVRPNLGRPRNPPQKNGQKNGRKR